MRILGIDTTGAHCQVCLREDAQVLAHISENIGRGHAEALGPMVERGMADADVHPRGIDRLVVVSGPGSFTGLRVGLAFATGFALPRALPLLAIDALSIAAHGQTGRVAVVQNVKRGQLAWAGYQDGDTLVPFSVGLTAEVEAALTSFRPEIVMRDPVPDLITATEMSRYADPALWPPRPLYARPPDAKLPGGIDPNG